MKFLIDECVWFNVVLWFKNKNFDVVCITEGFSGYTDIQVLEKAYAEGRILVTRDKDFAFEIGVGYHKTIKSILKCDRLILFTGNIGSIYWRLFSDSTKKY